VTVVAHHVGALLRRRFRDDFGDGVALRVDDEDFSAVGLEGQLERVVAYIQEASMRSGVAGVAWLPPDCGEAGLLALASRSHDLVAG